MRQFTDADKIDNARMDLVLNFPFYGSIFLRLNVLEDPLCQTAWVDGVSLGYNPKYVARLKHEEIVGLFVHEILHIILKHHLRERECLEFREKHMKWNYACDYALNPIIKWSKGMDISAGWLYEKKWNDALAEEVFYQLKDEDIPQSLNIEACPGEVLPFPGRNNKAPTGAEVDLERQNVDQWIKAAEFKAQGVGKLTDGVKNLVKATTAPTVCWQDELTLLCESVTKNNYTWTRPNQRYMQFGVYLPSMSGKDQVDMLFFVDTSGSLGEKQLEKICTEVQVIVQSFMIRVIVVYWDVEFNGMEVFDPTDVLQPEWGLDTEGGGGTNFERCWTWLDENMEDLEFDPKAIIFFSDLECRSYPKSEPGVPLLWCQVPESDGSFCDSYLSYLPAYGRHVKIPIYKED